MEYGTALWLADKVIDDDKVFRALVCSGTGHEVDHLFTDTFGFISQEGVLVAVTKDRSPKVPGVSSELLEKNETGHAFIASVSVPSQIVLGLHSKYRLCDLLVTSNQRQILLCQLLLIRDSMQALYFCSGPERRDSSPQLQVIL